MRILYHRDSALSNKNKIKYHGIVQRFDPFGILLDNSSGPCELVRRKTISQSYHRREREYGDLSIYRESIAEKFSWIGQKVVKKRNITAPYNHYITKVQCLDEYTDGTGADPEVIDGGSITDWVSLRFTSQRWHGIYFKVEVFAKRKY